MSRFLKIFLAMSVVLNLLLAGIIIGHAGRDFIDSHKRYTLQEIAMTLPQEQRAHFEDTLQRAERDTGELRQQLSDARKRANNLLKAESFDKEAYLAEMQKIRQLREKIAQRTVEVIAGLAEQESPEQRTMLADMLRYPPRPAKEE